MDSAFKRKRGSRRNPGVIIVTVMTMMVYDGLSSFF